MNNLSVTGCSEFSEFLVQQHSQFFNLLLCCHNSSLVMPSSESHFPLPSAVYFHDPTWRTNIHKNRMQVKNWLDIVLFFFIFWGAFFCLLIGIRQTSLRFCMSKDVHHFLCLYPVGASDHKHYSLGAELSLPGGVHIKHYKCPTSHSQRYQTVWDFNL